MLDRRALLGSSVIVIGACVFALSGCGAGTGNSATPTVSVTASSTATPPTKAEIADAPTSVTITCTSNGTLVSGDVVATSPTGVKLAVIDKTGTDRLVGYRIVTPGSSKPALGTIATTTSSAPEVYALPPGRMDLRCGRTANSDLDDDVTLFIVDPDKNYSSVDTAAVLGCEPKELSQPRIFPARATSSEALTLMAGRLPTPGTYTFKDAPGYSNDLETRHLVLRDGKGYGIATVTLNPDNLSYRPAIVATC